MGGKKEEAKDNDDKKQKGDATNEKDKNKENTAKA